MVPDSVQASMCPCVRGEVSSGSGVVLGQTEEEVLSALDSVCRVLREALQPGSHGGPGELGLGGPGSPNPFQVLQPRGGLPNRR